jgi:hypothetical protein
MTVRFDFSGVEQFLAGLEGRISPEQVFAHPAYQTVAFHARQFGTGLNAPDVENALAGPPLLRIGWSPAQFAAHCALVNLPATAISRVERGDRS